MMMLMSNKSQSINNWQVDSRAAIWQASSRLDVLNIAFLPTVISQDSVTGSCQLLQTVPSVWNCSS
jgi:hypothetical protein